MRLIKVKDRMLKFGISVSALCFAFDILIKAGAVPYFPINENYLYYVFSELFTVATLGSAFLAIYINVSSNKYYGFCLKEILDFKSVNIKLSNIVVVSLLSVVISIPILAFEYFTTMTFIAIFITLYILLYNKILWNITLNETLMETAVIDEIERQKNIADNQILIDWINRWFQELEIAIENMNEQVQNKYISPIKNLVYIGVDNDKSDFRHRLEQWIEKIFSFAVDHLGFVEAYQKIINLNTVPRESFFHEGPIIAKAIDRIKYYSAEEISRIDIPGNITDIIEKSEVTEDIKIFILYRYYNSIISNTIIHDSLKFNLLDIYFNEICDFSYRMGDKKSKTILLIYKNGVLENENEQFRMKIYFALLKQLFLRNRYSEDVCFIQTISQMLRSIYFYSILENETIKQEYQVKLREIIGQKVESMDNILISLPRLINENSDHVVYSLITDACNTDTFDIFDYFPEGFGVKTSIGTMETKIQFAFWIYCIFGYKFGLFPLENFFLYKNIENENKMRIYKSILSEYTDEGILREHTQNRINALQECLETNNMLPFGILKNNFDYFNKQLGDCIDIRRSEFASDIKQADLENKLSELMKEKPLIELDEAIPLGDAEKYIVRPHFVRFFPNHEQIMAREIQYAIRDTVNKVIEDILPAVNLEFNKTGVSTLLRAIKKRNIIFRNYTFIDDWAIDSATRETQEYKELCELIDLITHERTKEIHHNLFLTVKGIRMNAKIVDYISRMLTDEEAYTYVESLKVADTRYKIDGAVFDKERAIRWVKENVINVSAIFKLKINISKESGFRITFKHLYNAKDRGIITGFVDGSLKPEKNVTKAEFAAMITRALRVPESVIAGYSTTSFKDIGGYGWAIPYLAYCESKGILAGDEERNIFPGKTIGTKEAVTMALRAIGYPSFEEMPVDLLKKEQDIKFYVDYVKDSPLIRDKAAQILDELIPESN